MMSPPLVDQRSPVTAIVATRDRPELLRATLEAIRTQDYPGQITTLVVFDQAPVDPTVEVDDPDRRVRVISNTRSQGLAGARNSGIDAAETELIAFCDDDDTWRPTKLARQVRRLVARPEAAVVACGISVHYGDRTVDRVLEQAEVSFEDLLGSRLTELHPSGLLLRRSALSESGLVDEEIPGGYAEDYEFLLRLSRHHLILNVDEALVDVLWHKKSFFASRWSTISTALDWLLQHYPEFDTVPAGKARVTGQIAFAHAAAGDRGEAWDWTRTTLRLKPLEGRAYLAMAVASGAVSADQVLRGLHRFGRGI